MNARSWIFDATHENFPQLVLENSFKGLVLANYWAPGVGPCLRVWQVLEKLSAEYGGRFLLVNINTQSQAQLAKETAVNSLPTVKFFRRGQVIDEVRGAESESSFRARIESHLDRPSDKLIEHAVALHRQGDAQQALAILMQLIEADPENPRVPITCARLLIADERYTEACKLLAGLPETLKAMPEISALAIHVDFLVTAQSVSDPLALKEALAEQTDQSDLRYQAASVGLLANDYEQALEQLLWLVKHDRGYKDDIGRRGMLVIFDLLGDAHPLTVAYFSKLTNLLNG